ncbi:MULTISPECIES: phage protein [unclassified Pseudodesulfovibrio]|uniref:phage protein n=1 Tax=unclassified Pseudodesulfovibrio TaxID=2661612 RepID=UPI000FEB6A16|nr:MULTISPECIES: phage protein [unclassified Pseudodesulfovibrio]MCJ2164654.1 DUF2597 family protein [Pseudodesulfovibrio sp. S3-i]RWU04154.1 DUF2597 family protein [Pseudodesulfovibrio sp. S3]
MRISGKSFDTTIGDLLVHVEKISLEITDNSGVAKTKGVPDGYVIGDVEASGEIELDITNFNLISEQAKAAGSWRALPTCDIHTYAKTDKEELKVEAFGCKLKLSSLLDEDSKGGEKSVKKVTFEVTSPDFIHINGVPYLDAEEIKNLI